MEQALNNALATFEAFRRLGFEPDDIFFVQDDLSIFMMVELVDKSFTIYCGPKAGTAEEVKDAWLRRAEAWNSKMSHEERQEIWEGSHIASNCAELIVCMTKKGFRFDGEKIRREAAIFQKLNLH